MVKCQAGGAIPVASDFAALDETIQFGEKIHVEASPNGVGMFTDDTLREYKERLIWWLQHPEEQDKVRADMKAWARTKSWQSVAEQWDVEFNG